MKVRELGVIEAIGAGGAVPVPVSVTVCGDPVALSATESMAEKLAAEAGVNVTEIEQLAPAASELLQVLLCAKSPGFVPPRLTLLMVKAASPLFLRVTACMALVVPVCAVNAREGGVSEAAGVGMLVPVPLRATTCGDPVALSVTEMMAEKLVAEAGVKVMEMEQLAPAASELPQVFVCAKSEGFVPPTLMLLMVSVASPVFLSVAA